MLFVFSITAVYTVYNWIGYMFHMMFHVSPESEWWWPRVRGRRFTKAARYTTYKCGWSPTPMPNDIHQEKMTL